MLLFDNILGIDEGGFGVIAACVDLEEDGDRLEIGLILS